MPQSNDDRLKTFPFFSGWIQNYNIKIMIGLQFPLQLTFNIGTLSNDFVAQDCNGNTICYVRQKMLKLIEEVQVYNDENRATLTHTIRADRWLDFSASYQFTNQHGMEIGRVVRKGWSSLWKADYQIFDANKQQDFSIREENPWVKVMDKLLSEMPFIGILTGYFFHPTYIVTRQDGLPVVRLTKVASFWGRKFRIDKLNQMNSSEEERILLGLTMMILLERRRG